MAIRRGFMASGISRTSSILSRPLSKDCILDLNVVGQVELPLEVAGRDAAIQELALGFLGLAAFDGDDVLLCSDRDFIGREARDRQRDLVTVFREAFDVVGRVAFLGAALGGLGEVEKTIETDGRPEEGSEVISAHSQILLGAKWLIAAPDTTGARLRSPGPSGAREPPCGGDLENKKTGFWFQEGARKFFNIRLTAGCGRP